MNKRLLFFALAAWMLPCANVLGDDDSDRLFLFFGSTTPYNYVMGEEQTFIFKEDKVEVRLDDVVWEVEYDNLEKITLNVAPLLTAVNSMKNDVSGIEIRYNAASQQFVVESSEPLQGIDIFSLQGRKTAVHADGDTHLTFSITDLPKGIYVVRASDGTNTKTLKIMKR